MSCPTKGNVDIAWHQTANGVNHKVSTYTIFGIYIFDIRFPTLKISHFQMNHSSTDKFPFSLAGTTSWFEDSLANTKCYSCSWITTCESLSDYAKASVFSDETHSFTSNTTVSLDLDNIRRQRIYFNNQAHTNGLKRLRDSSWLYHPEVHSVNFECSWQHPAGSSPQADDPGPKRCLKASKSDSCLGRCSLPKAARHAQPLEEYSLGSGDPYAAAEPLRFNKWNS